MSRRNNQSSTANSTILYIGGVPFDWDENNLRSVVCGSGGVVDVRLGFDYSGKNKGFCFIEYITPEEARQGLRLLGQVLIHQGGNKSKKLRVELSKEGLRANNQTSKRLLQLDRNYLPSNVELPQEMLGNGPTPSYYNPQQQMGGGGSPVNQINQVNQMNQRGQQNIQNDQQQNSGLSSRNLPQPPTLPFKAPDKISENLSNIPPAQLIELIANLKGVLSGPNANRAPDVFQLSPYLASSAAQALLLMGFIDTNVINDAINAPQFDSTPQMQNPQPVHNNPQQPYGVSPQIPNATGGIGSNGMNPGVPMPSKWPFLPPSTQVKLGAMPPEQADLIAQVLTIPSEQIPALEPEKRAMVTTLRAQYLA
ncbi:hypothetical protein PSN45_003344 [Yamadazyma tenuis]|uniref:RRM domain-containing protein n=1 Tax=Candida tenuis (strain ATCC 10573 / BCRC 21748 / CBS 615 / JCM 9827 / NBRC 10315 / NRRL Y-1498 / VKM Y-70) TaxID=590646 RepID=G3AYH8_CANTC|nr:uncharacterized protein CANTEDRAFT_92191 [Yamadazyma tenuis ATCC 10573]EGV65853.1 hypothetical protein CANTEDRAFT_92191 [Yamadazyma tenuis ATCC 10573]WEJ95816.1 hypothetical protein PSN45_003344 [Yamadazyma tenuis]